MLKERLMTALILLPLMLGAIFFLPTAGFAAAMSLPVLAAAWEWSHLMGQRGKPLGHAFVIVVAVALGGVALASAHQVVLVGALFWPLAAVWVRRYPAGTGAWTSPLAQWLIGLVLLVPAWSALVWIHAQENGPWWLLYAMSLVWGADTGAYFAGRRWGRRKLAPAVSPGKTLEGLAGGMALTTALALAVALWAPGVDRWGVIGFVLLSVVTVVASVLGDLFESMAKRHRGIKDSSQLLPGHGGVLDRIDSVTAALPVFVAGLMWLGRAT